MEHHWFRVGRILDCQDDNAFYAIMEEEEAKFPEGLSNTRHTQSERNLWRLYQAIWKDSTISYLCRKRPGP